MGMAAKGMGAQFVDGHTGDNECANGKNDGGGHVAGCYVFSMRPLMMTFGACNKILML